MKRLLFYCLLVAVALAQLPKTERTELSDAEITEFIHANRALTDLIKKLTEAQAAVDAYNRTMAMKYDEMRKAHGAVGCSLDVGMRWANCPPPVTEKPATKAGKK